MKVRELIKQLLDEDMGVVDGISVDSDDGIVIFGSMMPDKSAEKARFAKFVDSEIWELLRNLEMGEVDCLSVEAKLNAAHEKALDLQRQEFERLNIEQANVIAEKSRRVEELEGKLETRQGILSGQAQIIKELEKKVSALEKVNRKMRDEKAEYEAAFDDIVDLGFDYDGFDKPESLKGLIDELVDIARKRKPIAKEALAEERP